MSKILKYDERVEDCIEKLKINKLSLFDLLKLTNGSFSIKGNNEKEIRLIVELGLYLDYTIYEEFYEDPEKCKLIVDTIQARFVNSLEVNLFHDDSKGEEKKVYLRFLKRLINKLSQYSSNTNFKVELTKEEKESLIQYESKLKHNWNLYYRFSLFKEMGFLSQIRTLNVKNGDKNQIVSQILDCNEKTARSLMSGQYEKGIDKAEFKLEYNQLMKDVKLSKIK